MKHQHNFISHGSKLVAAAATFYAKPSKIGQKTPYKKSQSYTKTLTKKKESMKADDLHSGLTRSHIKIRCGQQPKGMLRSTLKQSDTYNVGFSIVAGKQSTVGLCEIGNCNQAIDMTNPNPAVSPTTYSYSSLLIAPDSGTPAAGTWTPAQPTVPMGKMLIKRAVLYMQIGNMSNFKCYVDIYVCQAKQNIPKGFGGAYPYPDVQWQNSLNDESRGFPNMVQAALGTAAVAGNDVKEDLHSKPTDCYGWNKMFKVLRKRCIVLSGAAEEELVLDLEHNFIFDYQKIMALNQQLDPANIPTTFLSSKTDYGLLKGGVGIFCVARGGVVNSNQLVNVGITTSSNAIKIVITRKIEYSLMKSSNAKFAIAKGFSGIPSAVPDINLQGINLLDVVDT